jgi:hypothetical protein
MKEIAENLRKLTLGRFFSFKEFCNFTGLDEENGRTMLAKLSLDCHLVPAGKTLFKTIHGKQRDKFIKERIKHCEERIDSYYKLYKHLKGL